MPWPSAAIAQESDPRSARRSSAPTKNFALGDRPPVITALVTRTAWARALLEAIAAGKVPRTDVTAFHARQIHNLNDADLNKRLAEVWGDLRESPEGIKQLIAKLRTQLTPEALAQARPARRPRALRRHLRHLPHALRRRRQDRS